MSQHAFFAPSSAPRVVECPASLLLTAGMPDNQSIDAAHGTAAHFLADLCLRSHRPVDWWENDIIVVTKDGECEIVESLEHLAVGSLFFPVDEEMVIAVQEYVDWCNDLPGHHYPECRVDISRWTPRPKDDLSLVFVPAEAYEPQGGTSDHAACGPGFLTITDLKYGKGVKVFAENNYQAVLYALGFIAEWDWLYEFHTIRIRICQPRLDHKDIWEITREEIEKIGAYILERFTLALEPDAPFGPSEKACKFCKASGLCRAQKDHLSSIRALMFDDLDTQEFAVPDPRLLTNDELVEAWRAHGLYKARFDAIEREMLRAAESGVEFKGLKVVMANTHRQWKNEGEAAAALEFDIPEEKLFKTEMISPSQAEKLIPKKFRGVVSALAYKPRGGPCLVDAKDRRSTYEDAIAAEIENAFNDLDGQS